MPAFSFALKPRCWHRITVANHSELFLLKRRVDQGVCFALTVETCQLASFYQCSFLLRCVYVCHRVLDETPEFAIEHMQIEPLIAVL